jgi:hypothetical protein
LNLLPGNKETVSPPPQHSHDKQKDDPSMSFQEQWQGHADLRRLPLVFYGHRDAIEMKIPSTAAPRASPCLNRPARMDLNI